MNLAQARVDIEKLKVMATFYATHGYYDIAIAILQATVLLNSNYIFEHEEEIE